MSLPGRPGEDAKVPGTGVVEGHDLPDMSAGNQPSLGPLLEQQLLLTTQASPQLFVLFWLRWEDRPHFSRSEARQVSPTAKPTPRVLSHSIFLHYLFKLFSLTLLPSEFS